MTQPAQVFDPRSMLARLLDEHFCESEPHGAVPWELWEQSLYAPLSDIVGRPAKGLRTELVELGWSIGGGRGEAPVELGAIIEALHAGSLVIDDIEDGSASRRGGPALHIEYGVPRALNAGCWLYFWPHALLDRLRLPPIVELQARRRLGETLLTCHAGQALDLGVRVFELEQGRVPSVVQALTRAKSGALTEAAMTFGAIAAGARADVVAVLARYGRDFGVGLQMLDDLGGLLREDRCHKGHEDLLLGRATWPFAWLARELEATRFCELTRMGAEVHARDLHPEHLAAALRDELGTEPATRARAHLDTALERLEHGTGRSAATAELRRKQKLLEEAYV